MFCTQCGKSLAEAARFCGNCGTEAIASNAIDPGKAIYNAVPDPVKSDNLTKGVAEVRPWVRYWARMFDISLFSLPVGFLLGYFSPRAATGPGSDQLFGVIILFFWVFIEALLLSTFGTIPGKWLLKTKFILTSRSTLSYQQALSRSLKVWWRGLGAGIPIVSLITLIIAHNRLSANKRTSWDKDGGFIVTHEKIGVVRVVGVILFFVGVLSLVIIGSVVNAR